MYEKYFGLRENPFSITPDPAYLYLSGHHQDALGHLLYGAGGNGGFVQLTGEVGTGKTTLVRTLLEQKIDDVDVALCLNPRLTVEEFLASVCDELGVETPARESLKQLTDALSKHLLKTHGEGRRTVLLIDEAQNLSREVLEQVRLLTNLETAKHKLLRIILVGQPELRELLDRRDLRQLAQRITARHHLDSLCVDETSSYISHRLRIAGGSPDIFTERARKAVYSYTKGTPRLINVLCDRAMLGAYGTDQRLIDHHMVCVAAKEVMQEPLKRSVPWWEIVSAATIAALICVVVILLGREVLNGEPAVVAGRDDVTVLQPNANTAELPTPVATKTTDAVAQPVSRDLVEQPTIDPVEDNAAVVGSGDDREAATFRAAANAVDIPNDSSALDLSVLDAPSGNPAFALFLAWGQEAAAITTERMCPRAPNYRLHCMTGYDGIAGLRKFNRPAVLEIKGKSGATHPVLVRALTDSGVVLHSDGGLVEVPYAEILARWDGVWIMLYRRQGNVRKILPGDRGEPVPWLRRRLSISDAEPLLVGPGSDIYDAALESRVRQFQVKHSLEADGVVGGRTMSLLHGLLPDAGTPLLVAETKR